ncbi:transmembrane protein, putative [Medicago truncatula]|uniref:Transmembrane protein, putative n=1 Tax=Medicago truncatula TaxID=3880 RepID=A0A072UJX9_MEDTR|nr:transmembrane protein, putative [Medicago truncatula]
MTNPFQTSDMATATVKASLVVSLLVNGMTFVACGLVISDLGNWVDVLDSV